MPTKPKSKLKAKTKPAASKAKKHSTKSVKSRSTASKATTKSAALPKKIKVGNKPLSKSELLTLVSENVDLTKKQVSNVMQALELIIVDSLNSVKEFTLPGLLKIVLKRKPAQKARKGINPFTGEPTIFKAKPASNKVATRALKKLKDSVQ